MKLCANDENVSEIPQAVLDERLEMLSHARVADKCGSITAEVVESVLKQIRDEVVE